MPRNEPTPPPRLRRIAIVTCGLRLGGSTTFVLYLGEELRRRGWEPSVWLYDPEAPLRREFAAAGVPVRLLSNQETIFEDRTAAALTEIREFDPAIVIANLGSESFEFLRYVPSGVRRIALAHADDPNVYTLHERYAPVIDVSVGVSYRIVQLLREIPSIGVEKARLQEYGVRFPDQPPREPGDPDAPLRIIYLGRLEQEQKRVQLFPEIFSILAQSGIAFEWTLAGDGPERAFLERALVSESPQAKARFLGRVDSSNVPDLLTEQDALLLVSDYEGLPLSLLEAMGAGVIPVVSDLPSGIREVVAEETGFRVPTDNTAGYAEALIRLARDRELLQQMSVKARERVIGEHSVSAMADRWEAMLSEPGASGAIWPDAPEIKPPLGVGNPWYYRGISRPLRRLAKRLTR